MLPVEDGAGTGRGRQVGPLVLQASLEQRALVMTC